MHDALLFPGQGSQTPEMRELVAGHRPELLELALAEVGGDPFELADRGTSYAQPAILCASLAAWTRAGEPPAGCLAGHSLGELSALAAAGSIDPAAALRLAAVRGRLMQDAAEEAPGGMLALLGDGLAAREAAAVAGATIANDNAPSQIVVAGPDRQLDLAAREAKARGVRAIRLAVRGAFHTPAMQAAVAPYAEALERTAIERPGTIVFSSIAAEPFGDDPARIRALLAAALTSPVRWRETLAELHRRGVRRFVEAGPGKVLTGIVRRSFDGAEAWVLGEPQQAREPEIARA